LELLLLQQYQELQVVPLLSGPFEAVGADAKKG